MPQKVLIIEDESNLRNLVASILQIEGFETSTAPNGLEGKEKAKSEIPNLILLDVLMPKSNGYQIATELSLDPKTRDIPIVLMTGTSQVVGGGIEISTPAKGKLHKPFGKDDLVGIVKKFIR